MLSSNMAASQGKLVAPYGGHSTATAAWHTHCRRLPASPHHQRRLQLPQQRCRRRPPTAPPPAALASVAVPTAQLADAAEGSAAACSGLGCAQEAFDAVARPFAGLGALIPSGALLPAVAVVAVVGGLAAWRVVVYGRREYIVAAMMRKYVPRGGARIMQINGSTRDVFYYPEGTVSVRVVGPDVNIGLMEQAGASAGVPVDGRKQPPTDLAFQGTGSIDAVVAFNGLASAGTQAQQYFAEVARVLKPGAPFVFIDRVTGQGLAAVSQPLVGSLFNRIDEGALQEMRRADNLVDVTGDVVLKGQDPHAVGVAFRAGGRAKEESGKRGSDRPAAQRKSKSSGGKKRGFAGSKR